MTEPTAYEKMFTRQTGAMSAGHSPNTSDPRKSPSGLYPRGPNGQPSPVALRLGAEFQRLADSVTEPRGPYHSPGQRAPEVFISHIYQDHADALLPFETGQLPVETLTLALTTPSLGLKRYNITVSHVPA